MREFDDGFYWVQMSADLEPEIAMHDHGSWRLFGSPERAFNGDFLRIGRRVVAAADAFEAEIEQDGAIGV